MKVAAPPKGGCWSWHFFEKFYESQWGISPKGGGKDVKIPPLKEKSKKHRVFVECSRLEKKCYTSLVNNNPTEFRTQDRSLSNLQGFGDTSSEDWTAINSIRLENGPSSKESRYSIYIFSRF